jgi:hypothetical protein
MLINTFLRALLLVSTLSNATYVQSKDEVLMAQAIERLKAVMMQPDSVVLANLVSDDLEYVHSSGTVRNKRGFIDEFMKRQTVVANVVFSNQTITISGNNAIVRHQMLADSRKSGYPSRLDIIILMVWRKEHGTWKMLARQAAKIPQ